jgi:hypothetical protein
VTDITLLHRLRLRTDRLQLRLGENLLARADGAPIGIQSLSATGFAVDRTVETGSWLGAASQGRGLGAEMRAAVLELALPAWTHASPAPAGSRAARPSRPPCPRSSATGRWGRMSSSRVASPSRITTSCSSTTSGRARSRWRSSGTRPARPFSRGRGVGPQRRARSAAPSDWPPSRTRAKRSPSRATRSRTTSIVSAWGSSPGFTSSQRSGVETGAPARGRTE